MILQKRGCTSRLEGTAERKEKSGARIHTFRGLKGVQRKGTHGKTYDFIKVGEK